MILTVTANPALDYTIQVDDFEVGKRSRYRNPRIEPAGKGINVSRMLRRLGEPTVALGFAAGATGDLLRAGLSQEGVLHEFIPIEGLTRINVTLLTGPEGVATHLHGPGQSIAAPDVQRLVDRVSDHLLRAKMIVFSGSLPPGVPPGLIGDLIRRARQAQVRSLVDAEGDLLGEAMSARADLVKPNILEAGHFLGRRLTGVEDAAIAAREIVARGAGIAIITLRGEGAVAAAPDQVWHVRAPREKVVRAIGAGDSFAAGLAISLARGAALPEALRMAAAAGTATALHSGTGLGTLEEVAHLLEETEIRELT